MWPVSSDIAAQANVGVPGNSGSVGVHVQNVWGFAEMHPQLAKKVAFLSQWRIMHLGRTGEHIRLYRSDF